MDLTFQFTREHRIIRQGSQIIYNKNSCLIKITQRANIYSTRKANVCTTQKAKIPPMPKLSEKLAGSLKILGRRKQYMAALAEASAGRSILLFAKLLAQLVEIRNDGSRSSPQTT
jgi:hypothetical protein